MGKDRKPEETKQLVIVTTDGFIQHPPEIFRRIYEELKKNEKPGYITWLYEIDTQEETKNEFIPMRSKKAQDMHTRPGYLPEMVQNNDGSGV